VLGYKRFEYALPKEMKALYFDTIHNKSEDFRLLRWTSCIVDSKIHNEKRNPLELRFGKF